MFPKRFLALALAACAAAQAQVFPANPDWKEADAPPPPALRTTGLIPLELPRSNLRFGIDPASVTLAADGVVRYVVVAQSDSGAVNAMYEGIRCSTAEVKVYARHTPGAGWQPARNAEWKEMHGNAGFRHSWAIARNAACIGHAPNRSTEQIVRDLRAPVDTRFN